MYVTSFMALIAHNVWKINNMVGTIQAKNKINVNGNGVQDGNKQGDLKCDDKTA